MTELCIWLLLTTMILFHIFEALASYYETINVGPNDGESAARWLEVEIGEIFLLVRMKKWNHSCSPRIPEAD